MKQQIMRIAALLGSGILFGLALVLLLVYYYSGDALRAPQDALISPKTIRELQGKRDAITAIEWTERGKEMKVFTLEQYETLYAMLLSSTPLNETPKFFQVGATLALRPLQTIEIDRGGTIWRVETRGMGWIYFSRPGLLNR